MLLVRTAALAAAQLRIEIPVLPVLIGSVWHQQGLSFDPGANPAGLVLSNSITLTVRR